MGLYYNGRIPTWDLRRLNLKNVKKGEGSEILPHKLACSRFTDAGRTPETPESEAEVLITTGTAGSTFALVLIALKCHREDGKSGQGMLYTR